MAGNNMVLVVEDSPTQSMHLKSILEREGLKCVIASNGHTGLYLAQTLLPQAIVLDLEMPGLDGFQVCRELKSAPETVNIPIILMTRHTDEENIARGQEIGAVEFIPKDQFSDMVLLKTLRELKIMRSKQEPPV